MVRSSRGIPFLLLFLVYAVSSPCNGSRFSIHLIPEFPPDHPHSPFPQVCGGWVFQTGFPPSPHPPPHLPQPPQRHFLWSQGFLSTRYWDVRTSPFFYPVRNGSLPPKFFPPPPSLLILSRVSCLFSYALLGMDRSPFIVFNSFENIFF